MAKKTMVLAASVAALIVFAAMPALASAAPTIDPSTGKFPFAFTGTSKTTVLRAKNLPNVTCKKDANTGSFTNGSTGTVEITFSECTESIFGSSCTTAGQPTGTITTASSEFHLVYLNKAHTTVGILITGPAGGFATFDCATFFHINVAGSVLGHVSSPGCGGTSANFTVGFTAVGTSQTFKQVEEGGTVFNLNANGNEASIEGSEAGTFSGGATGTLTCI